MPLPTLTTRVPSCAKVIHSKGGRGFFSIWLEVLALKWEFVHMLVFLYKIEFLYLEWDFSISFGTYRNASRSSPLAPLDEGVMGISRLKDTSI